LSGDDENFSMRGHQAQVVVSADEHEEDNVAAYNAAAFDLNWH